MKIYGFNNEAMTFCRQSHLLLLITYLVSQLASASAAFLAQVPNTLAQAGGAQLGAGVGSVVQAPEFSFNNGTTNATQAITNASGAAAIAKAITASLPPVEVDPKARGKWDGFYRIKQVSTGMYLDAYERKYFDNRPGFEAILRNKQHAPTRDGVDKTQLWYVMENEHGSYSLMQYTSGRFLDLCTGDQEYHSTLDQETALASHQAMSKWYNNILVTKPVNDSQYATTQRWIIQELNISGTPGDDRVHIVNADTEMLLDAYAERSMDFSLVMRPGNGGLAKRGS
jgi:hypothetical protein